MTTRADNVLRGSARPILIAEDDPKTATLLCVYLEREGFSPSVASDGRHALELVSREQPWLVILDLSIPLLDGWEVCRELRRSSDVPILILTARGDEQDRIVGLRLGADDYVVKPFSPGEVMVRIKGILRRRYGKGPVGQPLVHAGLVLDREKRKVTLHGRPLSLTASQFKLLDALMAAPGRTFLREELLRHLYPRGTAVVDRVIDVHVGNLRQKIEDDPARPRHILTARGLGYCFADDHEVEPGGPCGPEPNVDQRMFETAVTGFYHTTLGGRYVAANPMLAQMFGYVSAPRMIESVSDLNDNFYVKRDRRAEFIDLVREHGVVRSFESEVYRRDGSIMWISEHATVLYDAGGGLVGFLGTTIDVTNRKASAPTSTGRTLRRPA